MLPRVSVSVDAHPCRARCAWHPRNKRRACSAHRRLTSSRAEQSAASSRYSSSLHILGYQDGQSSLVETRYADGNFETLPRLAAELIRRKVDTLVTEGTPPVDAATRATTGVWAMLVIVSAQASLRCEIKCLDHPGVGDFGFVIEALHVLGRVRLK